MPRLPVLTRAATAADLPALVGLWQAQPQLGGRAERAVNPAAPADIPERLLDAIGSHHCRVVLAYADGEPAGMAVLRVFRPDPLSSSRVVQICHALVLPGKRRRGAGHALVAAAAEFAEEVDVEHVVGSMYPSMRDASRFYARLGFAPFLVQRVAPVSVLRRRLSVDTAAARVDDVVRRRTRLRRPVPAQRRIVPVSEPAD